MQDIKILTSTEIQILKQEIKDKLPFVSDENRKNELLSYIGRLDDVNAIKVIKLTHDGLGIHYEKVKEQPIWQLIKKGFATRSNIKIMHQVTYILCADFVVQPKDNEDNPVFTNLLTGESFVIKRSPGDETGNPGVMSIEPPVI